MSNIDKQALRIPERNKHNWDHAVMRDCDFCQQWVLTVRHSDGGCICASCCDSEYTTSLSSALVVALDELEAKDKRTAEQADIIAKQEKWIKDVEATMISATDRAEAAEKRIAELEVLAFSHAILDVISERQRQRSVEGWTSEHDDAYQNSELADAAACYAIHAHNQGFSTPAHWPWSPNWWKQSGARRDLVKAGALILAEIERLDRAAGIRINGEG